MKDLLRRLARLESEAVRDADVTPADLGMTPEEYATAYTELTRLLNTPPAEWPAGALAAFKAGCCADIWAKYGGPLDALLAAEPGGTP